MRLIQKALDPLSRATGTACEKRRLLAAALVRIVFGAVIAVLYLLHFAQRHFLWGADAVVTRADYLAIMNQIQAWSLYSRSAAPAWAEFLYWAGLLVAVLFAAGLFTRVTPVFFFVFTWSVYQRNPYALDGGDNLVIILLIYLLFADVSALSLDRRLFGPRKTGRFTWLAGMLHNFALVSCLIQLGILYFEAGFYKIQGHVWSSGTAVYYILRSSGFALPGWSGFILQSAALVTLGTYGAMLFELVHPFLMWHPRLKYAVVAGAVLLHGSIGILMSLVWFSLIMIGVHALLFDDAELLRLGTFLRERARFRSRTAIAEPVEAVA